MGTAPEANDLVYNYTGIDTVAGAINSFVSQMNANLDDVDQLYINLMADGWTDSAGADAFKTQSDAWHKAAHAMTLTLQSLGKRTGEASIHMRAADNGAAALFQ